MINQFCTTEGFKARPNQTYLTNLPSHLTKLTTNHYNLQDLLFLPFRPTWHNHTPCFCQTQVWCRVALNARNGVGEHVGSAKNAEPCICIRWSCRDNSNFRLNSLIPLCLWLYRMYVYHSKQILKWYDRSPKKPTEQTDSLSHLRRPLQKWSATHKCKTKNFRVCLPKSENF